MVHVKQLQIVGSIIQGNGRCGKDVKMRVGRVNVAFTNTKATGSRYGRGRTNEYDLTAIKESGTRLDTRRNLWRISRSEIKNLATNEKPDIEKGKMEHIEKDKMADIEKDKMADIEKDKMPDM